MLFSYLIILISFSRDCDVLEQQLCDTESLLASFTVQLYSAAPVLSTKVLQAET